MSAPVLNRLFFVLGALFLGSPGIAVADDVKLIDCAGASLAREVVLPPGDRPITIIIRGTCAHDVMVKRDDVTLVGEVPTATVAGTITILGARRVLIRGLRVSGSPGVGILGTDNASFAVEDSSVEGNGLDGIVVRNGAHAKITGSTIAGNGVAQPKDAGRGIHVVHSASAEVRNNTVSDNRSDGVGVYNNSYVLLIQNTIERNGREEAGEAGVVASRARIRAHGNTIRNNTGFAAIDVLQGGFYRTGTGVGVDFPDNEFPFEQIEHRVGPGLWAIEVTNSSYGDFRQVHIKGSVIAGDHTMVQIRGDQAGIDQPCSTVDTAGGSFIVSGNFGLLRLRQVRVTTDPSGITGGGIRDITSPCL
jgi:parallel beta-helix repeat protein